MVVGSERPTNHETSTHTCLIYLQELPRVEKELEVKVAQWEKENGRAFLVGGKVVADFILDQWHIYHDNKEQEKLERVSGKLHLAFIFL